MNKQATHLRTAVAAAVLASAGMVSMNALAAPANALSAQDRAAIQQTYRAERGACLDGSSSQQKSACLAEASAVRKEALRGTLGLQTVARNETATPMEADLLANSLARCDTVPGDVRSVCERRVLGDDVIVVGSVAEGVIIRELPLADTALAENDAGASDAPASSGVDSTAATVTTASAGAAGMMVASPPQTDLPVIVAEATEPVMESAPAGESMYGGPLTAADRPATPTADSPSLITTGSAVAVVAADSPAADATAAADATVNPAFPTPAYWAGSAPASDPAPFEPSAARPDTAVMPQSADRASSSLEASPYPAWMQPVRFE